MGGSRDAGRNALCSCSSMMRPVRRRDRTDLKDLAHIRKQYCLSLGSCGRPRMTMELKEAALDVGELWVVRLKRINGI